MTKGIVLAGGTGKRMRPLTEIDNKHLLPVYNRRMIEYPVQSLLNIGIDEIILITGGNRPGAFLELFKNGKSHNIKHLYYTYQEGSGGIADALSLAAPFVTPDEDCVVILGDNYFEDSIQSVTKGATKGARCLIQHTDRAWDFGIATIKQGKIIDMVEKPTDINIGLAILGCYWFDYQVWEMFQNITPSARGELEITDILRQYMEQDELSYRKYPGYWSDMGTFESWAEVSARVRART
jgi:glucose-1-phosphate thymidylyltransferase